MHHFVSFWKKNDFFMVLSYYICIFKVLTTQILYPKCSRMQHFASFWTWKKDPPLPLLVSRGCREKQWPGMSRMCWSFFIKDEVLLTVSCPIFPSILIAKNLLTGSLKYRSIDNLETQKKSISMKNSQFFDYLLYAKSK